MTHEIDIEEIAAKLANGMTLEQLRQRQGGALSSGSIPPLSIAVPTTEAGRLHLERLRMGAHPAQPTLRDNSQQMEFDVAKRKVWALLQLRAAHISGIENRDFNWVFDEGDAWIVRNMTKYFINDTSCEFEGGLAKGLFLYGMPGTGKTELMQVFERFCRENNLPKAFQFTSMAETYVKAKSDKQFDPITPNIQLDRCFDEFGLYTGAVLTFGESLDINEAIIEARYKRFRQGGQLTHFISNASTAQTEEMVTPMIFDRLRSMCTGVWFKGQSKRK